MTRLPFAGCRYSCSRTRRENRSPCRAVRRIPFVTGGVEDGLEQAKAASDEKDVGIWGGAEIIQQYLEAGLLDETQIHLIPVLLGDGVRLFENLDPERIELEAARTIETPAAKHLRFTVAKRGR